MDVNEDQLAASLDEGDAWVAHGDSPNDGERKVGITVALRKLAKGTYQVGIDTYFIEGVYGTDISWEHYEFEALSEALDFIEAKTSISRSQLAKQEG